MNLKAIVGAGLLLALANIAPAGTVVYGVGGSTDSVAGGSAVSYTLWSGVGVDGTATSYTSGPIAGTVDGVAFTYTITVSAAGTTAGNLGFTTAGDHSVTEGSGDFEDGDGFSVVIGDITESDPVHDVVLDGFVHFSMNFCGTGEGAMVNGVGYTRAVGGNPNWNLAAAPIDSFEAISIGATRGRAVDFQFSTLVTSSVPPVTISPDSQVLRAGDLVSLATDPGFEIRFTTDGSDPDQMSELYTAAIELAASGEIRARGFDGSMPGPVASASYILLSGEPPSILLIVADDLGFNDLGCYGAVSAVTPRLDALAWAGQRFTQCTSAGPGDVASQYALLTGRMVRRAGLPESVPPGLPGLDSREWTLAEALRKAGYETGLIGSWHLGDPTGSRPEDQGFRTVHGLPADLATLTTQAQAFLANHAADRFFLLFQPPAQAAVGTSLLGSYGNQVEALDSAVGTLLDELDTLGRANDTLVVFLSDDGADRNTGTFPTGSNGQLRDGRGTTWEGGVRVPCIARWPGVIPAGDNYAVLWLPDLLCSLAEIVDGFLASDRPLDGTVRADVLLGARTQPAGDPELFLHRHNGVDYELRALRSGRWKLHQAYNNSDPDNTISTTAPLLYDLLVDPIEHVNRSGEQLGILAALQQLAADHEATFAAPLPQLPATKPAVFGDIDLSITEITPGAGVITYSLTRPADSIDDDYPLEHSDDLDNWTEIPSASFVTSAVIQPDGTEDVTLEVPLDHPGFTPPRHFVRLKASRP